MSIEDEIKAVEAAIKAELGGAPAPPLPREMPEIKEAPPASKGPQGPAFIDEGKRPPQQQKQGNNAPKGRQEPMLGPGPGAGRGVKGVPNMGRGGKIPGFGGFPGMGGGGGDNEHWIYWLSRGISALAAIGGYIIAGYIQANIWQRVLPPTSFGQNLSFVASFIMTVAVNVMQTAFRNTHSQGGPLVWWGIAAYFADFFLSFIGIVRQTSLSIAWIPGNTGTVSMTWIDWILILFFVGVLTFVLEPLIEYAAMGEMYVAGRRFGF